MKKYLVLLVIIPYLFIAGTGQTKRFPTADDMSKALLQAFQANDSLRYVELCATQSEAVAAFVTPIDSAPMKAARQKSIDGYFANPATAYTTFRMERMKVINEKLDWKNVTFVSTTQEAPKSHPKGIDYIYSVKSVWKAGDREISVTLASAMKTTAGWNCGMDLKIAVPPAGAHVASGSNNAAHLKADSTKKADSVMHAMWIQHHKDSVAAAHKASQPH